MEDETFWEVEVFFEPCVVFKMLERTDNFTPVRYAFTALRWISDDGPTFEHKNIEAFLCQTLCSSTAGWAGSDHDDLSMLNVLHAQCPTSCMTILDDVCDEHHHVLGLAVREPIQLGLSALEMSANEDFSVLHAA